MKTLYKIKTNLALTVLFMLFTGITAISQELIEVKNTQAQMSKGMQTCYTVVIPQADLKTVQQNWLKMLQEDNKVKVQEAGQELILAGVVKPEFTFDTINIYSFLIQKDSVISLFAFIEIDSVFFAPKEDKTDLASDKIDNSIKNYLRSFAVDQYRLAVTNKLKEEQKILESLEDDLKKLEKEEENLGKDNATRENDIEEKEREVTDTDKDIEIKRQEILTHNASMLTVTGEVEKKAAKEKQKDLEKEKNQLEKDRSKAKDDISSYKSDIEKNNKAIEDGNKAQEEKIAEIEAQKLVVEQVQVKLDGIK